jgi:DNA-binding NarL/FixJ family response regulator
MIQIVVVDPFEHMRRMIRALLETEQEWRVCGEAADGQRAIDQCDLLRPDLVILDIQMPVLNGLEAARQILLRIPRTLILLLTLDESSHFAVAAASCGAQGLLIKGRASEDLVDAVSALLRGERYFAEVA